MLTFGGLGIFTWIAALGEKGSAQRSTIQRSVYRDYDPLDDNYERWEGIDPVRKEELRERIQYGDSDAIEEYINEYGEDDIDDYI